MVVAELIKELEGYPSDAQVDAMFPVGNDAYWISGSELFKLADGKMAVVLNLESGPQLASA